MISNIRYIKIRYITYDILHIIINVWCNTCYDIRRQPQKGGWKIEDNLRNKTTTKMNKDDLGWKINFDTRWLFLEDDIWQHGLMVPWLLPFAGNFLICLK